MGIGAEGGLEDVGEAGGVLGCSRVKCERHSSYYESTFCTIDDIFTFGGLISRTDVVCRGNDIPVLINKHGARANDEVFIYFQRF